MFFLKTKPSVVYTAMQLHAAVIIFIIYHFYYCLSTVTTLFILHEVCEVLYCTVLYSRVSSSNYDLLYYFLKKNLNAPRPSEHPPVRGKKCQNV